MSSKIDQEISRFLHFKSNKSILKEINQLVLPSLIFNLILEYESFGKRTAFLWQWLHYGTKLTLMTTVDQELQNNVILSKSLLNMINVILDDVADEDKNGKLIRLIQMNMLEEIPINWETILPAEAQIIRFCQKLWKEFEKLVIVFPKYSEFRQLLHFDIFQMINGKYYNYLSLQQTNIINLEEAFNYGPHSMHGMIFFTVDWMASSQVETKEIGLLRSVYWISSVMAHLSNSLATWRREVKSRDFSSILFPVALQNKTLEIQDLNELSIEDLIRKMENSKIEDIVLYHWIMKRDQALQIGKSIISIDVEEFMKRNEHFLEIHLACSTVI